MRNLGKSFAAKLLLGVLGVAFVFWGASVSSISGSAFDSVLSLSSWITGFGPKDLAQVGGISINADAYTQQLQRQLKALSAQTKQNITLDDAKKFGLDRQVLNDMVNNAALVALERRLDLKVGLPVIQQDMANERAFQNDKGQFDPAVFKAALDRAGLNEAGYVANQMQMRTRAGLLSAAGGGIALSKAFSTALTEYQGETRDAKYFTVTATEADVAKPTDADLEAQYKKTPAAYTAPEYRNIVVMKIDPADIAAKLQVSSEEVNAGYEKYKADYFSPEKRTIIQLPFPSLDAAKAALIRMKSGEDATKIAGELKLKPEDVTLTDKTMDFFLDKKIGEAAFALDEGQVSEPVAGALATVLLKAAKVTPAHQAPLEEVKGKLSQRLQLEKAKDEIQNVYNAVEDARGSQAMKFEDIAEKEGLKALVIPTVSAAGQDKDGKDVDIPSKPEVLQAAFASDAGLQNDALSIGDGYIWYDVRGVTPSALKPLDQVKEQAAKDVIAARLRTAVADKARKLAEAARSGKAMETLAQENNTALKPVSGLKRNQQTVDFDAGALEAAFSVPEQGFATSVEGDGKSARVIQVTKVNLPAVMASSPDIEQLKDQSKVGFGNDLQLAFIKAIKKDVGVKINADLWKQNNGGEAPPEE